MTSEHFNGLPEDAVIPDLRDIFATKGADYATNADKLCNFKRYAKVKVNPITAWWILVDKHLIAIERYVATGSLKSEDIKSRLMDLIAYSVLALGLIEEQETAANAKQGTG